MTIHDFHERLAMSEQASDAPFWDAVYRRAFSNLVGHMACKGDRTQRDGVDRLIFLDNGRTYHIDEKKRDKVYPDILLEYESNDHSKAPGWICKDLAIDYLAYAFMPTQRCYLYSWPMLRRAWLHYGEYWKQQYQHVPGRNLTYTTWSVAVPISVIKTAISKASIIEVDLQADQAA